MKLHHIGYAVKDISKSIAEFEKLGYTAGEIVEDLHRNVKIAFLENGQTAVELVAPNGEDAPVDDILKKMGATPYHLCYEVEDMASSITEFKRNRWIVLKEPAPAPAISGRMVSFLWSRQIGLIELVQLTDKE